ncbi:aminotransferase class I/II-fold pyridoxal phosphate-dependent enzyme [Oceanobacillus piezotolerans]|uniref:Aminotransferase class I/II-fold pyridoxal phosphate-dependent enzyme n=1 Tax=Oceanobacillus piezotolerans TaxID=2448030 RepID=A0A498D8A3_9BACI|nr:aminotransferase class I/II-fold pyridoxal phosphate-dependent enzyme [Oceanobacillus piezotolerans]RLL42763.1 aminotransferase class I/II-fold pyridoxal phosphate-dependent enzyme [Oceanobacillus piezotolerans]
MSESRIFLSPPHMSGKEWKYLKEAFDTNWIAPLGPNVDAFEKEIAEKVGARGAVALSSGTAAIHLALSLLHIQKGDTVFCSTLTFVASANPILYQGAEPVFIDSEPVSWNMSPRALEKAFQASVIEGKLPKAVIVVNLYGQSSKMEEIIEICNRYEVPMIEDAAESLGTIYKGRASGTFGKFGIYSFNGNKILTTSGGGVLISDDVEELDKARFLATQARDPAPHYQHSTMGFNYRLSNLLAGVGRAQLEVLEERVAARRMIFETYKNKLNEFPDIHFMEELTDTHSNRWLSTFTINEGAGVKVKNILEALNRENIEARPVWKPLHLQPLFHKAKYFAHKKGEHIAESLFKTGICLPSGSSLTEVEQQRVIQCIKDVMVHFNSKRVDYKFLEYEV